MKQIRSFPSYRYSFLALTLCLSGGALAQTLSTIQDAMPVISRSTVQGPVPTSQVLNFAVSLRLRNPGGLDQFCNTVSNPNSVLFGHFLTPAQVGLNFGATAAQQSAVVSYFTSKGLRVTLLPDNRMSILFQGTVDQVQKALNTKLMTYQGPNPEGTGLTTFIAPSTALKVPSTISNNIVCVSGVDTYTRPRPRNTSTLTPALTAQLYKLKPSYNLGFMGQGRNVAISNFDGYRLSNLPIYISTYSLPVPAGGAGSNVSVIPAGAPAGTGTPSGEGDLDIQMALGMAPLSNVLIYDGTDLISVLTKEANDNQADIITESYGWAFGNAPSLAASAHSIHQSMTAEGITYMCASGDNGTDMEPYSYPNYDPEVLMVGGTVATVDNSGTRVSETGWSGSAGGWVLDNLPFNVLPPWQKGNGVPANINHRLIPDVSLHAAGVSAGAYFFVFNGQIDNGADGTSFSSPVLAGSLTVLQQRLFANGITFSNSRGRFGRLQDRIYNMNGRASAFTDIISGSNGTLPDGSVSNAKPGWDFVTGWGAINDEGFYTALALSVTPTLVTPSSIAPYEGTLQGGTTASVQAADGAVYSLGTAGVTGTGQVAGSIETFVVPAPLDKLRSISLKVVSSGTTAASGVIYLLNQNTGAYDYVGTFAPNGAMTTSNSTLHVNDFTPYLGAGGRLTMITRAMLPVKNGRPTAVPAPFVFKIDQLMLSIGYNG